MTDAQRTALGDSIAGTNQYKVLASVMQNFAHATDATEVALNSAGSAMKENERFMESLAAKEQALKSEFEDFANRVLSKEFVSGFFEVTQSAMEFINTDVGASLTRIAGAGATAASVLGLVGTMGAKLVLVAKQLQSMGSSTGFIGTLTNPKTIAIITGVVAGIAALSEIIRAINKEIEANKVESLISEIHQLDEQIPQLSSSLEESKSRLEEINATPWSDRTTEINKEAEYLDKLISYYERLLAYQTEQKISTGKQILSKDRVNGVKLSSTNNSISGIDTSKIYKDEADALWDLADAELTLTRQSATNSQVMLLNKKRLIDLINVTGDYEQDTNALKEVAHEYGIVIQNNTVSQDEAAKTNAAYYTGLTHTDKQLNLFGKTFDSVVTKTKVWQEAASEAIETGNEYYLLIKDQIDAGNDVSDALMGEYNAYQELVAVQTIATSEGKSQVEITGEIANKLNITRNEASELYNEYYNLAESGESVSESFSNVSKKIDDASETVLKWANVMKGAADAKATFDSTMDNTGDYDDAFKGLASVFKELKDEFEAGQIGSLTFKNALAQLVGQDTLDAFDTASDKSAFIANQMERLTTLYGDAESGGLGFLTVMQELSAAGELYGATLDTTNGQLSYNITDFDLLAQSMGVTTSQLWALVEAGKIYGSDVNWNVDGLISAFKELDSSIVTVNGNITEIDFTKVAEGLNQVGYSKEAILEMKRTLEDTDNVRLVNIPDSIDDIVKKAKSGDSATEEMTSELKTLDDTSLSNVIAQVSQLGTQLLKTANNADKARTSISNIGNTRISAKAEGTDYAKAGPSLVNEEGPELIKSGNTAYIAGEGYPTITHLNTGDKVYTAEETKDILSGASLYGTIQAHAWGTRMTSKKPSNMSAVSETVKRAATPALTRISGSGTAPKKYNVSTKSVASASSSATYGYSQIYNSSNDSYSKTTEDAWKSEFETWLKAKKHALAMDEINEAQYYKELTDMNNKYFAGRAEYQEEYWKYQEDIYNWEKKNTKSLLNDQLDALRELQSATNDKYDAEMEKLNDTNNALEDQIKYEQLLADMAAAKGKRVYQYVGGKFAYVQDYDAISSAQDALDNYWRDKNLEAKRADIEKRRNEELDKIAKEQEKINAKLNAISGYAGGTAYSSAGLHLVGEDGPELRVLNRGDSIIPSKITSELLSLGRMASSISIPDIIKNISGGALSFNNVTMSFPSVTNGNDANQFIESVKRLAYQRAFAR